MGIGWQIMWLASGAMTLVGAPLASRSRTARYVARAGVGLLFLVGGALLHLVNLATGVDYAGFADPAHVAWVTDTWRAVVGPRQSLFIGLLVAFEAAVGILVLSGGRRTRIGLVAVLAFYLALCLFGWIEVIWFAVMVGPILLLLRAERSAATRPAPRGRPAPTPTGATAPRPSRPLDPAQGRRASSTHA